MWMVAQIMKWSLLDEGFQQGFFFGKLLKVLEILI